MDKAGKVPRDLELLISNTLRTGLIACGLITLIGLVRLQLAPVGLSQSFPTTLPGIWQALRALHPYGIIDVGLIVLILTPLFRVAASVFVYLRERDYTFVAITLFVLTMLIISFALGKAG
ncbi:DUF1634 domain-containing protein [Heliobacterium gestii]|uniref:DUF1634 domain-containing protein n=1 Tax=Heliomicrobium gestii TaxID=2699 RepID=A0A845LA75_HELGE|nr:DUF1634 domain-containing protein [Heliomicrobium gestii]MBM7867371.1 putative membrane protein [Heliomicrobium gestii]MZP43637.1 DUF1634 domain-containing protein [Heliomicrobium gestii]